MYIKYHFYVEILHTAFFKTLLCLFEIGSLTGPFIFVSKLLQYLFAHILMLIVLL